MPDANVPVLGRVPKGALWMGGIAAVGVTGFVLYRSSKKKATGAATGSGAYAYGYGSHYYGYGGGYGYGAGAGGNPISPYPTGSEYGYGAYGYGYYNPYTGQYLGGGTGTGGGGVTQPPQPTAPTTNLQWATQANTALGGKAMPALLKYLGGLPLSTTQVSTVQEAIGAMGNPPVASASGYPPAWHTAPQPPKRPHHKHHKPDNTPVRG
jgi:hypothetical protein